MKKSLLILIPLFLFSCKKNENSKNEVNSKIKVNEYQKIDSKKNLSINKKEINLDFFKSIPDTLDGCLYSFTYDSINSEKKYILLSNGSDINIIKIKGKEIFLNKDTINTKQLSNSLYKEVYFNDDYKLILNIEEYNSVDETSSYKGTLEISNNKHNHTKKYKIKGEGGC